MNKSFKVVFSKARSALMVVNEATSSIQAKGTKTVIAAAAAAMIAGGAVAAAVTGDVTVTGSLTWTPGTDTVDGYFAGQDVTVPDSTGGNGATKNWTDKTDTLGSASNVVLAGGTLDIANHKTEIGALTGKGTVNATATKDDTTTEVAELVASSIELTEGTINLGVYNAKAAAGAKGASLTTSGTASIDAGVLNTKVAAAETGATASGAATAKLASSGAMTLGVASEFAADDTTVITAGTGFDINSDANTEVSSAAALTYNKGTVSNTADLLIKAGTASGATIGQEVVFAKNTGKIELAGNTVTLDADYDATAEGNKGGKLYVNGTTTNTVNGAITASSVKVGAYDATAKTDAAYDVILNGASFASGSALKTTTLTFASAHKALTMTGDLTAETTKVSVAGAALTVEASGSASLGDITVDALATTGASLTLTNKKTTAIEAKSLTLTAGVTTPSATQAGAFTVEGGDFTVGALTNAGTINVGKAAGSTLSSKATNTGVKFTVTGTASNAGTMSFATADDTIVIGKDSVFTNTGVLGGTDATKGTLEVAGQLTNSGTGTVKLADLVVSGMFTTGLVTLNDKGEETTNKAFQFGSITLDKGGVINVEADASGNALKTFYAETKDKNGKVTKTVMIHDGEWNFNGGNVQVNGTTIAGADYDVVMGGSAALTANFAADYEFGNVSVAKDASAAYAITVDKGAKVALKKVDLSKASVSGSVTVSGGASLSATELTLNNATVTVDDGTVTVTDKLTTTAAADTVTVNDGALNVTAQALGFVDKNGALDLEAKTLTTTAKTLNIQNGAAVNISGLDGQEIKEATLKRITGLRADNAKGFINLGDVTLLDSNGKNLVNNGEVDFNAVSGLGVTTNQFKDATVTKVAAAGFTAGGNFKNLKMDGDNDLTVQQGTTVILNGTGDLVTYTANTTGATAKLKNVSLASGAAFVATGTGAVIGSVKNAATDTTSALGVEGTGSLTVKGDVDVGMLYTDAGAAVTVVKSDAKDAAASAVKADKIEIDGVFTAADSEVNLTRTSGYTVDVATGTDNADQLSYIAGKAAVKALTTAGDMFVTGTLDVTDKITATGKTVYVGNDKAAGALSVGNLAAGTIFADPAWVDGKSTGASLVAVKSVAVDATVEAGRNSIVSVGTTNVNDGAAALAKSGFTLADTPAVSDTATGVKAVKAIDTKTVNSVIYVNGGKTATAAAAPITGNVVASAGSTATSVTDKVQIAGNSMLAINMNTVATDGSSAVFTNKVEFGANGGSSVLYLDNVTNGQTVKLSATSVNDRFDAVFEGDMLMSAVKDTTDNTKITVQMDPKSDIALYGVSLPGLNAAYGMFEEGKNLNNNSTSAKFNKWLYTTGTSPVMVKTADGSTEVDFGALSRIATDVASLGATTGVQTMTMDAVNQMGETVADRVSLLTQRAAGVNVWAAANGGMFEAKSLFDGAGYESDIYSGVLGVDYQFACNAVLGAALTIGTADTDNKNSTVKASTDSDLVGFSVYTSKTFADVIGVSADIGYLTASNDVTANGYDQAWKFSQDTDAFTIGLRTEVLAEVGAVKLVPHIGIRYTALSTDGFEAGYKTEIDDQNVFQMPVGVTVSGDFQTGDWTVAPKFDLSVVPTFGDKDADLKLGITGVNATDDLAVRVIDSNPVQATLGVNATNGAWGFGLNYKLGVGSDDRMNNTFNINVRYAF